MTDVSIGRVRLVVERDGKHVPFGRVNVTVASGYATAVRRRKPVVEGDVVSVEHHGKARYTLTMADGSVWATSGCGCGGG